jgi:hypothetical protein
VRARATSGDSAFVTLMTRARPRHPDRHRLPVRRRYLPQRRIGHGLTTAASLWSTPTIGTLYGVGAYWLPASSALATLFALGLLRDDRPGHEVLELNAITLRQLLEGLGLRLQRSEGLQPRREAASISGKSKPAKTGSPCPHSRWCPGQIRDRTDASAEPPVRTPTEAKDVSAHRFCGYAHSEHPTTFQRSRASGC